MKSITGREFIRVLERNGYVLSRVNGSHYIYVNPASKQILSVPVHGSRDLRLGTLRALLKAAGLTEADL